MPFQLSLFGFPVVIDTGFLILLGIYGLFAVQRNEGPVEILGWWLIVFVSILVHELGHAFVARFFGLPVGRIKLHGFGGDVTHGRTTPGRATLISLAGPAAGISFGLLFGIPLGMTLPDTDLAMSLLADFLFVNIGWSILNLVPMYPLDGGQALGNFLEFLGFPLWSSVYGLGFALGILLVGCGLWWGSPWLLIIGGSSAMTCWQQNQNLG